MRKVALLAAAAAAFVSTPALAGGYVGATYGSLETSGTDATSIQLEGAAGWNSDSAWGGQIDGSFGNIEPDVGGDADTWSIAGHLYWGNDSWRLGGVLASSEADFGGGLSVDEFNYGFEGSANLGASAVGFGSLTFGTFDFIGTDIDTWNVDFRVNFYASDNVRFGFNAGTGNMDAGIVDGESTTFGADAEFQPWSAPISVTLAYSHYEEDVFSSEEDGLTLGIRWNFGSENLRARDEAAPFAYRTNVERIYDIR